MFSHKELYLDLARFFGWDPFDANVNPCFMDSYYANSLKRKHGLSIEELLKKLEELDDGRS